MEPIAVHPYYKVEREVTPIEQKSIEYERMLYLYEDKLVTHRREFPAEQIFDISYREIRHGEALLYLHTSRGVFSYTIKEDPSEFIKAFKELEKRILAREAEKYD
ncbi:hypothetical protein [Alkalicoccus saliphilus]|jgi:hypothetical protein|uniref:Uncharacterized protein n=1 Tax=Alkalicoccus saliphilus TaxID=200989 RepID=A0A2T4U6H0_9BACI|nr:hypothetical protein [Alkalicoccus saliphilus]PTL38992.1 hypothetical protein C6Y45_08405 [Alkalicoccus saliphilus]